MSDEVQDAAPQEEAASEQKRQSNTILNLIMILLGVFFFVKGILDLLMWLNIMPFPAWLQSVYSSLEGKDAANALSFLGPQGIISATLGFWSFIAGILLFREQESGWGMALVILSTMLLLGASTVVNWIIMPATFDLAYWPNWITMLTVLVGFFGFIYLLLTKRRYD